MWEQVEPQIHNTVGNMWSSHIDMRKSKGLKLNAISIKFAGLFAFNLTMHKSMQIPQSV